MINSFIHSLSKKAWNSTWQNTKIALFIDGLLLSYVPIE